MVKRILTLPDIHEPYNINLKPILKFCDDFNPHILQFLGDTTNAESCNHWKEEKGYRKDIESVEADQDNLRNKVIKPFKKALSKRAKIVYHIGNHEWWYYEAMAKDLRSYGKYDLRRNLADFNIQFIDYNQTINFGFLYFIHGIYTNKYHANKMATNYRKCLIYGHTHDIQSFTLHSPIDCREKILAKSIGCLCKMNPDFLRDKPNQWINSFNYAYVRDDGTFNEYTTIITDGKFIVNGKRYG